MSDIVLPPSIANVEQVASVRTPIALEYTATPGISLSAFLRAMARKQLIGDQCPDTGQVFVPPRGVSPMSGKRTTGFVDIADRGYIESFNVTRIPAPGRDDLVPPFVSAWIVLDGASVGFLGAVQGIEPEDVYIGMRVEAVWKPDDELTESAGNILHWRPNGEPDVEVTDYETVGRPEGVN